MTTSWQLRPRVVVCFAFCAVLLLAFALDTRGEESTVERRARLAQMDPQDRESLAQNYQRFLRLDDGERERLRRLHAEIEADPQRDELRKAMQGYHDWLNALPASQRLTLAALPAEDRVKRIEEMRAAQVKRHRLGPADVKVVDQWIAKYDFQRRWFEAQRTNHSPSATPEELADLRGKLSDPARKALDEASNEEEQRRLVRAWVFQTRMPSGPAGSRGSHHRPKENELRDFLTKELSDSERSYLRALPPDQMQRELYHLWRERHGGSGEGSRERGDGRPSGSSGRSERSKAKRDAPEAPQSPDVAK